METERLIIEHFKESDKADYFENISHDKEVLKTFMCKYTETLDELDFSRYLDNKDFFGIRLKDTGKVIGLILICISNGDECEIGYGIGSKYWGNGYVTEAVKAFIPYCFNERGYKRVIAGFFTGNDRSKRVMEKNGMTYSHFVKNELNYLGVDRDVTYYAINKE